ncbi:MAG: DMT family transporter [Chloroflexi bacterium]|nr:DMT family transporter [Chloroflexota bacterium]
MSSLLVLAPIILAVGAGMATQNMVNTALSRHVSAVGATFISVTGTFIIMIVALALGLGGSRLAIANALHAPPYLWIGGIFGVAVLMSATLLLPKVGGATFVAFLVAGQLIGSLALDQVGAFGLQKFPVTLARVAGAALLLVGARLIAWR